LPSRLRFCLSPIRSPEAFHEASYPPRILLALAAILALIGHHGFHADEPPAEEAFQDDRIESVLFVNLSGPQGTVLATPTATLPVEVIVERHEWEIRKRPSAAMEEARPLPPVPAMLVTVNLNVLERE
jgi:hypothetical protein